MKVHNGWIFGLKADLVAFVGPVVIAFVCFAFYKLSLFGFENITPSSDDFDGNFYKVQTYINLAHLYSTFWYTYTAPSEWKVHQRYFIAIPMILLVMNIAAAFMGRGDLVHAIFAHFTVWHFIKQQQAWFHISANKGAARDLWTMRVDNAAIIAATMGFTLVSQCGDEALGWFVMNDLIELPLYLRSPLLVVSVFFVSLYVVWHTVRFFQNKTMNWVAHYLFIVAALLWGYSRLGDRSPLKVYLNQLIHAFPYLVLGYRYMMAKRAAGEKYIFPKAPIWLLAIAIFVIAGQQGNFEMHMRFRNDFFSHNTFGAYHLLFISVFFNTINLTHYVIDMFFWNRKYNPDWVKVLAR